MELWFGKRLVFYFTGGFGALEMAAKSPYPNLVEMFSGASGAYATPLRWKGARGGYSFLDMLPGLGLLWTTFAAQPELQIIDFGITSGIELKQKQSPRADPAQVNKKGFSCYLQSSTSMTLLHELSTRSIDFKRCSIMNFTLFSIRRPVSPSAFCPPLWEPVGAVLPHTHSD